MTGRIEKIKIFFEKGKPGQLVQNAALVADCGLQGDRFAKGGEKQLTITDKQCEDWMARQSVPGLCFNRYKANITVENFDLSTLKIGQKLILGSAVAEVSSVSKECFEECVNVQNKLPCMLRLHAKYLKVIQSGNIAVNDEIKVME